MGDNGVMGLPRVSDEAFERSLREATPFGSSVELTLYRNWHSAEPTLTLFDMVRLQEMAQEERDKEEWADSRAEGEALPEEFGGPQAGPGQEEGTRYRADEDAEDADALDAEVEAWIRAGGEIPLVVVEGNDLRLPVFFEDLDSDGNDCVCHYYPERALDEQGRRLPNSYSPDELGLSADTIWRLIELHGTYHTGSLTDSDHAEYETLRSSVLEAALASVEVERLEEAEREEAFAWKVAETEWEQECSRR